MKWTDFLIATVEAGGGENIFRPLRQVVYQPEIDCLGKLSFKPRVKRILTGEFTTNSYN